MEEQFENVLSQFFVSSASLNIKPFGNGLINDTYIIHAEKGKFILQKINTTVFTSPQIIASNLELAGKHLANNAPDYLFIRPLRTIDNEPYAVENGSYWRLTPFVENSYSMDIIEKPEQAYLAAQAFGKLTKHLHGIDTKDFNETIPNFHNLSFRFRQFTESIEQGREDRKQEAADLIANFLSEKKIVTTYEELIDDPKIPIRVMHHDTKINNVLFDKTTGEAITVCDLDTLMPGLIISDIGDMFRTSLSPLPEDSTAYGKIKIREKVYDAIYSGYLSELAVILTETEKKYLNYGGEFMIYMQGIRFLADYLNGDIYYHVTHSKHNFERATNQWVLLKAFQEFVEKK